MADIAGIMTLSPVIPVVTVDNTAQAVAIAGALQEGGVPVIEITRRTAPAFEAVEAVKRELPAMCVGVGTVWTAEQTTAAVEAGAEFIVSPGVSDAVDDTCREHNIAYLPGAGSASEIAYLARRGRYCAKVFPAGPIGGPSALKHFASVLPEMTFCPTGGVNAENAREYLAVPSVACVGGSWLTPHAEVEAEDWAAIRAGARSATALATG